MRHFLLKFNAGVEIGARLAYVGHYDRTKAGKISYIIQDELDHRKNLIAMLNQLGTKPNVLIDAGFWLVGHTIRILCKVMPIWSLDIVARLMEMFAFYNYEKLSLAYPQFSLMLKQMAASERDHEAYFAKAE